MNIFIDTNIFLSFYHFTSDDLEELKKLGVLLKERRIRLFLPGQIIHELNRNRENKIADALKKLREQKLSLQFPQFCKEYSEYEALRALQGRYSKVHDELIKSVVADIKTQSLKADAVIQELLKLGDRLSIDDAIRKQARIRMEMGDPPGKRGSLGDALSWETLLKYAPNGENLYFITDDKDFASPLDPDAFNAFLRAEWIERKKSQLISFRSLSSFFQEHFPQIVLASELEKELLIRGLANSSTFSETHAIIAKLRQYSEFSEVQVNAIVQAAISNDQVYWIITDSDVYEFLSGISEEYGDYIEPGNLAELRRLLGAREEPEWERDEVPF